MDKRLRTVAIILAGGIGERMKLDIPKQLLKIAGRPIIEHTLSQVQNSPDIDEIIIMMTPGYINSVESYKNQFSKVSAVLEGGNTRNETSKNAIKHLSERGDECNVLFHDAVRPFISNSIIKRTVDALGEHNAVDVVIQSADTIVESRNGLTISDIPDRSTLRRGQTPQGFKLSTIRTAYEAADKDPDFKATDDCSVVLNYMTGVEVAIVEGDETNIKVTHPLDATIADKLFQMKAVNPYRRSDEKKRELLQGKTVVVFGGSYGIGAEVVSIAKDLGVNVFSYSRSQTNTDITSEQDVTSALENAAEKSGRIDYIINTAGELKISELVNMSTDEIESMIKINYTAPAILAKLAKPYLDKTSGQLLLFTSSSYTRGRRDYSIYSSSKAATVNFVQALADEWSEDGVSINCINPERTATPMRTKAFGDEDPTKLLSANKVASASIDALLSGVTGQVFDVRIR